MATTRPTSVKVILTGWGIRDTHAQTSSLSYGYDNWLRGAVGYSGFAGEVGGEKKNFAMGSYRFTADGAKLEFLHQFSNNTWGYGANAAGDSFGGTANNAPIFFGGIPATAWAKGSRGMSAKKINVVDKAHTITPNFRQVDVMGGWTAAAGSTFIYSAQLPPRLQGMAMVCEPTMKLIGLMDVQPDGAGYVAKDAYSLVASSDEWMSPVFAEVGPDGAIWFADWQNFIIQHNPTPSVGRGGYDAKTGVGGAHENDLRDHSRGRIYRIVWDKAWRGRQGQRRAIPPQTLSLVFPVARNTAASAPSASSSKARRRTSLRPFANWRPSLPTSAPSMPSGPCRVSVNLMPPRIRPRCIRPWLRCAATPSAPLAPMSLLRSSSSVPASWPTRIRPPVSPPS